MALTRKLLRGMGLTDEQIDTIIEAHTDTVDALKTDIEHYKEEAASVPELQKQLEKLQSDLEAGQNDSYKAKYDSLKEEYEGYKSEVTQKESHAAKEKAYRALLREAGVNEKRIDTVLRVTDIDGIELDESGAIKDSEKLVEGIKSEWADFISTTETRGAQTSTPPANNSEPPEKPSRAAQIAAEYHKALYGDGKENN